MAVMQQIFLHGLMYGALLSAILGVLIWGSIYLNPMIWLDDYPPDIRAKFGTIDEKAKKQKTILALIFFLTLIGILLLSLLRLPDVVGSMPGFFSIFLSVFTILMVFNLVDLLILDGLIGIVIQPKFMVLPGTEGMAGYRDFGFHLRGFLKGTVGLSVVSLVIAGLVLVVGRIL